MSTEGVEFTEYFLEGDEGKGKGKSEGEKQRSSRLFTNVYK